MYIKLTPNNSLKLQLVLQGLGLLILPAVAWGSEQHENHSAGIESLTYFAINFAIYLALLYWMFSGLVKKGWQNRRLRIEDAVTKGQREVEAAQIKEEKAQQLIRGLPKQIEQLKQEIARDAELEAQQILLEAQAKAERILRQAKDSAAGEEKAQEVKLRQELAETVIVQARAIFENEINAQSDSGRRRAAAERVRQVLASAN